MKQAIRKQIKEVHNVETEPNIYTLLLDMNSIMKMALSNDKKYFGNNGKTYGMFFLTFTQIKKMLKYKNYDYIYAFYDGEQSGIMRYEIYHPYKANRDKDYASNLTEYDRKINDFCKRVIKYSSDKRKSLREAENKSYEESEDEAFDRERELVFSALEELFVRQEISYGVEGDDLIAYYVKNKLPNEKIVIFSGDRDLTQLIADDVTVFVPQLSKFITPKNHTELIGYHYQNVVLKKIICGDDSDNIKGIKGVGESTLFKLFPKIKTEKVTLEEVLEESKQLNEERVINKKKPLKSLENIINRVTDGEQGDKIYEINEQIISLDNPMLSDEAKEDMETMMYAPIDPSDRGYKNLYEIIQSNGMSELLDEKKFSSFFADFNPIIEKEKKRFENS